MANEFARQLRHDMPDSERKLWRELSKRQVSGNRFHRQHPLGIYVVDFVCLEKRFIVEVDGGQHSEPAQIAHDERRSAWLAGQGFQVFRVSNTDVFDNLDGVVETIFHEIEKRPLAARSKRHRRDKTAATPT
jgi:very-short-patch-repair endonuclease